MTKKTGLFDVDFTFPPTSELAATIKGEQMTTARHKPFTEALKTVINQMQVSILGTTNVTEESITKSWLISVWSKIESLSGAERCRRGYRLNR